MLPNFVFSPTDIVVALGQDGLVANTMKYLEGQPLIGLNPEPSRWDGILLPFRPEDLGSVLEYVAADRRATKAVTMAEARLSDGQSLEGERLEHLRRAFDEDFWASIPPVAGAVDACRALAVAGHELNCVTALPEEFRAARERNLRLHGFPIDLVHATGHESTAVSPKAETLNALKPCAFVDDYLPYFVGVDGQIHRALILRSANGTPNEGLLMAHTDSQHGVLAGFVRWWLMERV